MATKKAEKSKATEIKKDLIPEPQEPEVKDASIVDKALDIAKESMKDNKPVLDKLDDNSESEKKHRRRRRKSKDLEFKSANESNDLLNNKKSGVNKKIVVLVIIVIVGGVIYWKREYLINKWLDFKAKRILKELEDPKKEK